MFAATAAAAVVVVVPNKGYGSSWDADWLRQSTTAVPDPLAGSYPHRLSLLSSLSLFFFLFQFTILSLSK